MSANSDLEHIGVTLHSVLKEISRRFELRQRIQAELGRPVTDREFLVIAERSGLRI